MRTIKLSAITLSAALLVNVLATPGYCAGPKAAPAAKPTLYSVVRVGTEDDVRVIPSTTLKDVTKKVEDEDKEAQQKYKDDKAAALKNKEPFDQVQPPKRKVKVLKDKFKTEQDAKDWMEKWLANPDRNASPTSTAATSK